MGDLIPPYTDLVFELHVWDFPDAEVRVPEFEEFNEKRLKDAKEAQARADAQKEAEDSVQVDL